MFIGNPTFYKSNYTHGDGWSSFYHSGSYGSSNFYDDYDFTANWSESFDGVTEVYSSAHSASNDIEGDEYNLSGYFSDYYNTYSGQSPDSGSYSDSYPSSNPYASTTSSPGFNFTWSGWDVNCRQGVYLHNSPYSSPETLPYGLGSYTNPVEQPSSAWPTDPETPEPYTSPSQRYVDDIDDFFYGYDNETLYETGLQDYGEITVTNASGSASYSTQATFYAAFQGGDLGNEGVGSGLTIEQKQYIGDELEEQSEVVIRKPVGGATPEAQVLMEHLNEFLNYLEQLEGITSVIKERGGYILQSVATTPDGKYEYIFREIENISEEDLEFEFWNLEYRGEYYLPKHTDPNEAIPYPPTRKIKLDKKYKVYGTWHIHPLLGMPNPSPEDCFYSRDKSLPGFMLYYGGDINGNGTNWFIFVTDSDGKAIDLTETPLSNFPGNPPKKHNIKR